MSRTHAKAAQTARPTPIKKTATDPKLRKPTGPRKGSKAAKIISLLKRPQGVSLKELLKVTSWQPHSVRGFLSGVVAKKMGLAVKSSKAESGERRYTVGI